MAAAEPWMRVYPPENDRDLHRLNIQPGPKNMPDRNASPIAYFYLMFSVNLIKKFVLETNRYARQFISESNLTRYSRVRAWRSVTLSEFKGFLAVIYNMGLIKKPSVKAYWNSKQKSQATPWFRNMFSRNRFQLILKFLHLVDNRKTPSRNDPHYDPASWFKPLVEHANMNFKYYYVSQREVTVDESLVGTKCRSIMTQYIPSKSSKFGIKLWMLVESCTGYIIHFIVYRGRRYDPTPLNECQGTNVVLTLLRQSDLLNKYYHVVCDSFFTSLSLARRLLELNTYITGTLRKNRSIPRIISDANLGGGESVFARQGRVLACAYKEREKRKPVRLLSTACSAQQNNKPSVVEFYNKNMGGVDLNDMMTSLYDDTRKSRKAGKRVCFNIFHRMMLNAYILYKQNSDKPLSRIGFIEEVIEALSKGHLQSRRVTSANGNARRNPIIGRNAIPQLKRVNAGKERNCSVCSHRERRKRSRTECNVCRKGVHALCLSHHVCEL